MGDWKKILLVVLLLLIGAQVFYAGAQNIPDISDFPISNALYYILLPMIIGMVFIVLGILIIKNRSWVKIPLLIFTGLLFAYSVYGVIGNIMFLQKDLDAWTLKLMKWLLFQNIEYAILSLISFILTFFVMKKEIAQDSRV